MSISNGKAELSKILLSDLQASLAEAATWPYGPFYFRAWPEDILSPRIA